VDSLDRWGNFCAPCGKIELEPRWKRRMFCRRRWVSISEIETGNGFGVPDSSAKEMTMSRRFRTKGDWMTERRYAEDVPQSGQ